MPKRFRQIKYYNLDGGGTYTLHLTAGECDGTATVIGSYPCMNFMGGFVPNPYLLIPQPPAGTGGGTCFNNHSITIGAGVVCNPKWFCLSYRCIEIIHPPNTVINLGSQMMEADVLDYLQNNPLSISVTENLFSGAWAGLTNLFDIHAVGPVTLSNGNIYSPLHITDSKCAECCTGLDSPNTTNSAGTTVANPFYQMQNVPTTHTGYAGWLTANVYTQTSTNLRTYLQSIGENSCGQCPGSYFC